MTVNKIKQPYFLVIGLGKSGMSMAKFLRTQGETVIATDIDESKINLTQELNSLGIHTEIGFHHQETFDRADVLIPSPGIPLTNLFIKTAMANGVPVTGELDIFSRYNTLPVIAITGTNGKTTTTTLIGNMLKACGRRPFVCGNIGTPLMDLPADVKDTDIVVAELSSFQLDISNRFRPDVGVLLNISEDHLDRYDTFEAYETSKWSLFKHQTSNDTAIINHSIKGFEKACRKLTARPIVFSTNQGTPEGCQAKIGPDDIQISMPGVETTIQTGTLKNLLGTHNRENIAAAVLACLAVNTDIKGIIKGLHAFKDLPHRMEFIQMIDGVSFYNDSKATNTDAVIRAIECFPKNIILILGGKEKGTDFSLLIKDVHQSVKHIIALGESKTHIKNTFETVCPVTTAQTMKNAVELSFEIALKEDIVLFSPACASFDMYNSYVQRGNDFVTNVKGLENN